MNKKRNLPPVLELPTRSQGRKKCLVMSEVHVETITLSRSGSFALLTINDPVQPCGAAVIMTRDELEAMAALLRLAIEDAERLDAGKEPLNTLAVRTLQ